MSEITPPHYFKYYCHDCGFKTKFPEGAHTHSLEEKHFVSSRKPSKPPQKFTPKAVKYAYDGYFGYNPRCPNGQCD